MVWDRVRGWLSHASDISSLGQKAFGIFQGRHTFFAIFFAGTGFYLALTGKLTDQYVNLITALQAIIFAHSTKEAFEDYAKRKLESN